MPSVMPGLAGKKLNLLKNNRQTTLDGDMTFKGFDGKLYLCLHRYFHSPATRVQIWEMEDTGKGLKVLEQKFGAK